MACSECGKRYQFAEGRLGDTVKCNECGADVGIPDGRSRRGKRKKKQSSRVAAGVMIGGSVGTIVLIGLIAVLSIGRGQPSAPQAIVAVPANPAASGTVLPNAAVQPNTAQPNLDLPGMASAPANVQIPDTPVMGKIHGRDFMIEKAVLVDGMLTLRQGKEMFPDLALDLVRFTVQGESLEGKKVQIAPDQAVGKPIMLVFQEVPG